MKYIKHSFVYMKICTVIVKDLLTRLNYSQREIELGEIAAYMHGISNVANRINHAQSGR